MDKKIYMALGHNVFVKEIIAENKIGNWVISDEINEDFSFGEVVSCAKDGYFDNGNFIPATVAIGDKVVFPKVAGSKVTLNGEKLVRVFVEDIVAKEVNGEILPEETENK